MDHGDKILPYHDNSDLDGDLTEKLESNDDWRDAGSTTSDS